MRFKHFNIDKGVKVRGTHLSLPRVITVLGLVVLLGAVVPTWLRSEKSSGQTPIKPSKRRQAKKSLLQRGPLTWKYLETVKKKVLRDNTATPSPQQLAHKVTTTVFWAGEGETTENGFISNVPSAWDEQWMHSFGGVDTPDKRNGYLPAGFAPKENPFYFALPYSDFTDDGHRRPSAYLCPNAGVMGGQPYSWCKNAWIMVRKGDKTAYAQWEDVGPFEESDADYVFGTADPKNQFGVKAGLDVSPAVRDFLKLQDVDVTEWQFVAASSVPDGPWKQVVTTSLGYKNQ